MLPQAKEMPAASRSQGSLSKLLPAVQHCYSLVRTVQQCFSGVSATLLVLLWQNRTNLGKNVPDSPVPGVSAWPQLWKPWEMLIQAVFQGMGSPEECPIQSAHCPVPGSRVRTCSMCMSVVCVWCTYWELWLVLWCGRCTELLYVKLSICVMYCA